MPRLLAALRAEVDEVVVSDGGSVDATVRIARELGAVVVDEGASGRGPQLAAGARRARGDRLWFLHADAGVPVGSGRAVREATAAWGCFEVQVRSTDPRLKRTAAWMNRRARRSGSATGDMGIWIDRVLLEQLGGVPELRVMEDLVLTDRARARSRPDVLAPPLELDTRRWESSGVNRTVVQMWALRVAFRLGVPPERLARGWVGWDPR